MPLSWSFLEHVPTSALEGFACARDFWWEVQVQDAIREIQPVEPPEYVLVGSDSFGPVVVVDFYIDGTACKIIFVGTATHGQKNGYGTEAVQHVLTLLRSGHFGDVDEVWGLIHRLNTRSKAMMRGCGFEFDTDLDPLLEMWTLSIGP